MSLRESAKTLTSSFARTVAPVPIAAWTVWSRWPMSMPPAMPTKPPPMPPATVSVRAASTAATFTDWSGSRPVRMLLTIVLVPMSAFVVRLMSVT